MKRLGTILLVLTVAWAGLACGTTPAQPPAGVRPGHDGYNVPPLHHQPPWHPRHRVARQPAMPPRESPEPFVPWWQARVSERLDPSAQPWLVDPEVLVFETLRHSHRVRAISETPLIRQAALVEAASEFDIRTFAESRFVRSSLPVGDTLTTGGPPRLRDADWRQTAGFRRKTRWGGTIELSQRIGLQGSNSVFFTPQNQGNARLALSFNQPLLNGAGKAYSNCLIVLAEIDTRAAWGRTRRELQDHLLQITEAYWELYLQRAALIQKRRHVHRAAEILTWLEKRKQVDSLESEIARARAAFATRHAQIVRAGASIRSVQATLRALVNGPGLTYPRQFELVPRAAPNEDYISLDPRDALVTAMRHRPEIDEAMQEVRAASVRLAMSKNELLPVLDLVLESYVSGLAGSSNIGSAWSDQFGQGEPSYTAGLRFELPWGNRAARARNRGRLHELRQLQAGFRAAIESIRTEAENAVREVDTAYRELQGRRRALQAAEADLRYLRGRLKMLRENDVLSSLLADLLDSQDRLAAEEFQVARLQVNYVLSLAYLKRATGTLLEHQGIEPRTICESGAPRVSFEPAKASRP